jgi:hypothetical protein
LDRTEDRGQLLAPVSGSDRQSAISVQLLAGLETNKKGLNQDIFDEKKRTSTGQREPPSASHPFSAISFQRVVSKFVEENSFGCAWRNCPFSCGFHA